VKIALSSRFIISKPGEGVVGESMFDAFARRAAETMELETIN